MDADTTSEFLVQCARNMRKLNQGAEMIRKYNYTISEDGQLVIIDGFDNRKVWQGRFLGLNAISTLLVPESEDSIVLLDWRAALKQSVRNIIRCNREGEVIWVIGPPIESLKSISRANDAYDAVNFDGKILKANSLLSFLDDVDAETGKITKSVFLK